MTRLRKRLLLGVGLPLVLIAVLTSWYVSARLRPESLRGDVLAAVRALLPADVAEVDCRSASYSLDGRLVVEDLALRTSSDEELLGARRVVVDVDPVPIAYGRLRARTVELDGLTVRLHRGADGRWLHEDIVRRFDARETGSSDGHSAAPLPAVRVRDGVLSVGAADSAGDPINFELRGINASVTSTAARGGAPAVQISVDGHGDLLRSFSATGDWMSDSGALVIHHLSASVDLARRREGELPRQLEEIVASSELEGRLELSGSLRVGRGGHLESSDLSATVSRGRGSMTATGSRVESLSAVLHLDHDTLRIESLRALTSAGSCEADGHATIDWSEPGKPSVSDVDLRVAFQRITIDDALVDRLPEPVAKTIDQHRIRGAVAVTARLLQPRWPPRLHDMEVEISPLGLMLQYDRFSYRTQLLGGALRLAGGTITVDPPLTGIAGTGVVKATGEIVLETSADGVTIDHGRLVLEIDDLTADAELGNAIQGSGRKAWDEFEPAGRTDATTVISWERGVEGPRTVVTIRPRNVKFQYHRFPVQIDRVQGTIEMDMRDHVTRISGLRGRHRQRTITSDGVVHFGPDDKTLDLKIASDAYSLNDELLAALPEQVRRLLVRNRLSGESRFEVRLRRAPTADQVDVTTVVDVLAIVAQPPRAPFPVQLDGGRVEVENDAIRLRGLSSSGQPRFVIDGEIEGDGDDVRRARLTGKVKELSIDDRILGLMGEAARSRANALRLRGTHDFSFETEFLLEAPPEVPRQYTFRIHDLESRGVGLDVGLRVTDGELVGELSGSGVLGGRQAIEGSATLTQASFNRLRFTDTKISFVFGREHPAVTAAREGRELGGEEYTVRPGFVERLAPNVAETALQILVDPADLFGGEVRGFFFADLAKPGALRGHFVATDVDFGRASRSIFEVDTIETTGVGSGEVRFSGMTGDVGTLKGEGRIAVRGARFADIPLFSRTVEAVTSSPEGSFGFSELEADFHIADGKFHAESDDLLVKGSVMNLRGRGTMDFYGTLELELVPNVVDVKIPLVDLVTKQLAAVEVTGRLENPSAQLVVLKVPFPLGRRSD